MAPLPADHRIDRSLFLDTKFVLLQFLSQRIVNIEGQCHFIFQTLLLGAVTSRDDVLIRILKGGIRTLGLVIRFTSFAKHLLCKLKILLGLLCTVIGDVP